MPKSSLPVTELSGQFWRIVLQAGLSRLMDGARSPEGRFHHAGQPALYLSPDVTAAGHAIATYLRPDDPPRVAVPLVLRGARVMDLRQPATVAALGLAGDETAVPWVPQRAIGQPATTWRASDAVRAAGADGMIYTARSAPERWHLVLFRWNAGGNGAQLAAAGPAYPWP